ncbi:hypothetical protein ACP275_14G196500 [Erythranthe tilingii]
MGCSYNNYLFVFTFLSLTYISSADLVSDVCSKTKDPAYCFKFVKPLYKLGTTTPIDFTNATLEASKNVLYLVYLDILGRETKASKSNNPVLAGQYRECKPRYEYAVSALRRSQAISDLPNHYKRMARLAGHALTEIQYCDSNFTPIGSMPADFKALHQNSLNVCDICLVLTTHLAIKTGAI